MEEKKEDTGKNKDMPDEVSAAIAAGIILHRSGPDTQVALYEGGLHDEGYWGRFSRAGVGAGSAHRTRRG